MERAKNPLLPIEGFSYETAYGRYVATVVESPSEITDQHERYRIEVEFRNESDLFFPVRRLCVLLSEEDMRRDRAIVFRLINEWMFAEPGAENYFAFELHFGEVSPRV